MALALPPIPEPSDLAEASVRALVLDPHSASRIGIGVLLHRQPWVARCLLATDRDEARVLAGRHRPDVAIVDISDAGPFVESYVAPLHAARPAMPIVLSSRCRLATPPRISGPGSAGYLSPGFTPEELIAAVRGALLAEPAATPAPVPAAAGEPGVRLSEREREVLALISTGATNPEIAAALHVGTETVKKHAGTLYRKLGVRNRTEAAQRAAELLVA